MPETYVVDTDVLSYLLKRDTRSHPYLPYLTNTIIIISFMSLAKLEHGGNPRCRPSRASLG